VLARQTHLVLEIGPAAVEASGPTPPENARLAIIMFLVSRYEDRPKTSVFWPIGLRDLLPVIPVPLTSSRCARSRLTLKAISWIVRTTQRITEKHIYLENPRAPAEPRRRTPGLAENRSSSIIVMCQNARVP